LFYIKLNSKKKKKKNTHTTFKRKRTDTLSEKKYKLKRAFFILLLSMTKSIKYKDGLIASS
jgi:hypothetical protein